MCTRDNKLLLDIYDRLLVILRSCDDAVFNLQTDSPDIESAIEAIRGAKQLVPEIEWRLRKISKQEFSPLQEDGVVCEVQAPSST